MNKKSTRISRVQATSFRPDAACTKMNKTCLWKKGNVSKGYNSEWRLQLHHEIHECCEQSRHGLKKQARKHRSSPKLNSSKVAADISVKQPNKLLAGCWINAKVMFAAMQMVKTSTITQLATKVLTQPATSSSEMMWTRTSMAWTWPFLPVDLNISPQGLGSKDWAVSLHTVNKIYHFQTIQHLW